MFLQIRHQSYFHPNTLRLTFSSTFFFSALRGPPLDENLLLSNIATANKKVEHLTEVRFTVKDLTDATGLFLILGTQARALNIDQAFILIAVIKLHTTNIALEKISPQFIYSRVSSLSIVASMPFRDPYRFINRLYKALRRCQYTCSELDIEQDSLRKSLLIK